MADIAREMNVSKATVSRALNGKEDISEELKKEIIAKCHEMGYAINYNAKALSSNRKQIIGIVVNELMSSKGEFFYKEICLLSRLGHVILLLLKHSFHVLYRPL